MLAHRNGPAGREGWVVLEPDRDPARQRGFTLLELLVAVAVVGLVASVLVSRGPGRSTTLDLRAATGGLAAVLREARARAIESDRDVLVAPAPDGRSFAAAGVSRPLPARVTVQPGENGRPPPPVLFRPDGSASGGRFVLGEDGHTRTVAVDWLTGAVSVS